ncbi:MAG: hypothetical protein IT553_01365 [Sphingomonadaceae bacterium]|nr:hypothetical protein [Sphingomonadaceae bacterium]
MQLYCDESGGVGSGVMLLAAVTVADADSLLTHIRAVMGLRGELKGSRITMAERAFVVEAFARAGGRAIVAQADIAALSGPSGPPADHHVYGALLNHAVAAWLPTTDIARDSAPDSPAAAQRVDVTIDDGRYDALRNLAMRDSVQKSVGKWGSARLADSRRCAGVQFADVIANSHFHVALDTREAARIDALFQPLWQAGIIRRLPINDI